MSACSATTSTSATSVTSVTTGRPTSSRTSASIARPAWPSPWNAYGEVRGLYAPPRNSVAPAFLAIRADARVCSAVSTAHGPAMSVNVSGPIGTPPTRTVVRRGWFCADTSLYGAVIRIVSVTPESPLTSSVSSTSSVPITPMIVRVTPRLTNALPPCASMCAVTVLISASVAPGAITTTMDGRLPSELERTAQLRCYQGGPCPDHNAREPEHERVTEHQFVLAKLVLLPPARG